MSKDVSSLGLQLPAMAKLIQGGLLGASGSELVARLAALGLARSVDVKVGAGGASEVAAWFCTLATVCMRALQAAFTVHVPHALFRVAGLQYLTRGVHRLTHPRMHVCMCTGGGELHCRAAGWHWPAV